ncbi:nascent polypeptide-associated complex subunit alpha, muscle-specific form-like isoform X1 [Frankliniella occidentalis]|uniref:Nascent polypeptide-associated complex subunit alpha, muscle-specific form-like isoform X1 n=1 Tax=Frankliniella occidentalis TaxID=133901 RepID=A0A9C6U8Q7_FRAOC|nr:nascent polypeptide-associated complex subunit alpha, muscle-specific form-like isoform X1 [Frankliniella occidentalis]
MQPSAPRPSRAPRGRKGASSGSGRRRRHRRRRRKRVAAEGAGSAPRRLRRPSVSSGSSAGAASYARPTVASMSKTRAGLPASGPVSAHVAASAVLLRHKLTLAYRAARAVNVSSTQRPPVPVRLPTSLRWGPLVERGRLPPAAARRLSALSGSVTGSMTSALQPPWDLGRYVTVTVPTLSRRLAVHARRGSTGPRFDDSTAPLTAAADLVTPEQVAAMADRPVDLESIVTSPQNLSAASSKETLVAETAHQDQTDEKAEDDALPLAPPSEGPAVDVEAQGVSTAGERDSLPDTQPQPVSAVPEEHAPLKSSWLALYKKVILGEATRRAVEASMAAAAAAAERAPKTVAKGVSTAARKGPRTSGRASPSPAASPSPRIVITASSRAGSIGSISKRPGSSGSGPSKATSIVGRPASNRPVTAPTPSPRRRGGHDLTVLTTQPVVPCMSNFRRRFTRTKRKTRKSSGPKEPATRSAPASAPTTPLPQARRQRTTPQPMPTLQQRPPWRGAVLGDGAPDTPPSPVVESLPTPPRPQPRRRPRPATATGPSPRMRRRPPWRSILPDEDEAVGQDTEASPGDQCRGGGRRQRDAGEARCAAALEARVRQQAQQARPRSRPLLHSWFTLTSQMPAPASCSSCASPGPASAMSAQSVRLLNSFIDTL